MIAFPYIKTCHATRWLLLLTLLFSGCQWVDSDSHVNAETTELIQEPADAQAAQNLANLLAADTPAADLAAIFGRYNPDSQPQPAVQPTNWQVGDTDRFFYTEQENETVVETTAVVVYASDALVMWVEEGVTVHQWALTEAVDTLENEILPTTRTWFGDEPNPGIDGDPAIHILHIKEMGGATIGYFSGKDEYLRGVAPHSNERELFYINLDFVDIGEWDYFNVVSHEFQHMIHWNQDRNEQTWLNEGLSELSTTVNGYGGSDFLPTFLKDTDTSLTGFDYEGGDYAAAWLFASWLQQRYGQAFIHDLVSQPKNGIQGINQLLNSQGHATTFEKIYANWMVAVYALNHNVEVAEAYRFPFVAPYFRTAPKIQPRTLKSGAMVQTTVGQFGTDYWALPDDENGAVSLVITPTQQIRLIDADPHSGRWYWTTTPADFSDMHLTRPIDLSAVTTATLEYQTWFDLEPAYDYVYVSLSADGGNAWETVSTTGSVDENPHGRNFGHGITGLSGDGDAATWVRHTADLSPWAGSSNLLLRFTYITDDAVQHQGFAIDDIAIKEIGWFDDVETGDEGWQTAGFVRHTNRLPQTFIVQTLTINNRNVGTVTAHQPAADGRYEITVPDGATSGRTILLISGSTPVTVQPAGYHIATQPAP